MSRPSTEIDERLLLELTGQTEVSEPDHARALLGLARRAEEEARAEHERTHWPLRRARFRMLPVTLRMPPLVAALVLSSVLIFAAAMLLVGVHLAGLAVDVIELIAVISIGYTLGFGVILYLLNDGPGEHDDNRAAVRRRELRAAFDARDAAAAKVARLERETKAREELVERVIAFSFEQARRRRQEAIKAAKRTDAQAVPAPPGSPAKPDPPRPEYGGG